MRVFGVMLLNWTGNVFFKWRTSANDKRLYSPNVNQSETLVLRGRSLVSARRTSKLSVVIFYKGRCKIIKKSDKIIIAVSLIYSILWHAMAWRQFYDLNSAYLPTA